MSQPALTNFFNQTKRATRNTRSGKVLDVPVEAPPTKRSTRGAKKLSESENDKITQIVAEKPSHVVLDEEANILKEIPENHPPKVESEAKEIVNVPAEIKEKPKRGRKKVVKEIEEKDDCPSPAKRQRSQKSNIEQALEVSKKLTPAEVKEKLQGAKKLSDLKEQLKKIEKSKESVKVKEAKAKAAAKKVAEDKAKKDAKLEYEKSPAYIRFHNLALKDDGTFPLPYSYKFLEEVFRCTEQITAMLHNRQEVITFEKLKLAVQQMLRKSFTVGYLKQIKTVFPEAYRFAWENIIGRYGKKLAEFELNVVVNMKYKEEMIKRLGGDKAPVEDQVANMDKMGPQSMVERKSLFRNGLINIVKTQHKQFCSELKPPIVVDESKSLQRFHKDFNVDKCSAIEEAELPAKPEVEVVTTAAQILEKSKALFQVNPKLSETLATAAEKKKEEEVKTPATPTPAKAVRKDLQGLPQKLIDKILAKEAEQAAKDMLVDKVKEDKIKQLRRLPEIARILKSLFVTERKPALLFKLVTKKALASYPGNMSEDNMIKDIKYTGEITGNWVTMVKIQGNEYLKINNGIDINNIVAQLEKKLAEEEKK